MPPESLEWLQHIGSTWNRGALVPSAQDVSEVLYLVAETEKLVVELPATDEHREYMVKLCAGLRAAARDVQIYGGVHTARLTVELIGALDAFLPADPDKKKSLLVRLKGVATKFVLYVGAPAVAQLTADAAMLQIAPPGQ